MIPCFGCGTLVALEHACQEWETDKPYKERQFFCSWRCAHEHKEVNQTVLKGT